jgi:DNA-binding transcriptional ArsR family regulator
MNVDDTRLARALTDSYSLLNALSDFERQHILAVLAHRKHITVGELAAETELSRPAVSHHIKILREAGLLSEQREGVRRYYSPQFGRAEKVLRYLSSVLADERMHRHNSEASYDES